MDALHIEYGRRLRNLKENADRQALYGWLCTEMNRAREEGRDWQTAPWPPYPGYVPTPLAPEENHAP